MMEKDLEACDACFVDKCPHKKSEDYFPNCPAAPDVPEEYWSEEPLQEESEGSEGY